jgi:hypothetical protein
MVVLSESAWEAEKLFLFYNSIVDGRGLKLRLASAAQMYDEGSGIEIIVSGRHQSQVLAPLAHISSDTEPKFIFCVYSK